MRKKLVALMMIFTSLGVMYVSANAETSSGSRNSPNNIAEVNSFGSQVRYVRYRGRLYRVRNRRVPRYRYNSYNRPRIRSVRIPRIRYYRGRAYRTYNRHYYRSYNRRDYRPRVRYRRY